MPKKAIILAASVMALAIPASAQANNGNPQNCEANPQQPFCGSNVTVEPATAEECPTGGVVIIIGDSRYPVCNGANGTNGTNGADGTAGSTGTTTVVNTITTVVAPAPKKCVSHRKFSLFLPVKALRHSKTVRVTVAGKEVNMHPNKAGRIKISLEGLTAGVYAVVVQTPKGVKGIDKYGHTRAGFYARQYAVCGAGNLTALNVPVPTR
jgi:hypothetical protein